MFELSKWNIVFETIWQKFIIFLKLFEFLYILLVYNALNFCYYIHVIRVIRVIYIHVYINELYSIQM